MNPYSGEAIVELAVQSESGLESSGELEGIIVPSRSSVVVDLTEILPGRATLNVVVETTLGSVVAAGRHGARGVSRRVTVRCVARTPGPVEAMTARETVGLSIPAVAAT